MGSKRRHLITFLAGTLAVASFFILSSIAVVWANGLLYNPETRRFEQTVVIATDNGASYNDVEVLLNGQIVAEETPFKLRNLQPGFYEVLIRRDDFNPWRQTFDLSAGQVGLIQDFQLIAAQPRVTERPDLKFFDSPQFEVGLTVTTNGELLDNNRLITRFIGEPLLARRFNNGYLYQVANELRFHIPDGPQDYLIYKLSSGEVITVNLDPSDWEILLAEGTTVKQIELTVPTALPGRG